MKDKEKEGIISRLTEVVRENKSQNNLSKTTAFEQKKISNYLKTGNPSPEFLIKLYTHLRISPLWILTGVKPKYIKPADAILPSEGKSDSYKREICSLLQMNEKERSAVESDNDTHRSTYRISEERAKYTIRSNARDSMEKLRTILTMLEKSPALIMPLLMILKNITDNVESQ
ncbi:MAG: hypothetical protein AB1546_01875 [bacterium]